jgi:hypothetical protein
MTKLKFIIGLCSLLFANDIGAKCDNYCSTKKYYRYIHDAEGFILSDNFFLATRSYKEAFKHLDHPFSMDLYTASICMLKSKIKIKDLQHWNREYFYQTNINLKEKFIYSDSYQGTNYYKTLSEKEWSLIIGDTIEKCDYALTTRKKLQNLYENDQSIRSNMEELYGIDKYDVSESRDKIKYVDSLNLAVLVSMLSDSRCNAYEIGKDGWDALNLIILHNSQWNRSFFIADQLKTLVRQGKFDNRLFAYLVDRFCENISDSNPEIDCVYGNIYGEKIYWVYEKYHTYPGFTKNAIETINTNRQDINLNLIEDRIKQLIYQKQKENLFLIHKNEISSLPDLFLKEVEESIDNGSLKIIE